MSGKRGSSQPPGAQRGWLFTKSGSCCRCGGEVYNAFARKVRRSFGYGAWVNFPNTLIARCFPIYGTGRYFCKSQSEILIIDIRDNLYVFLGFAGPSTHGNQCPRAG